MNNLSLSDVDILVQEFLDNYTQGLSTLHRINYGVNDKLSFDAFIKELSDELRTGCVTFINTHDNLDDLNSYLFYISNAFAKQNTKQQIKRSTEYLCPGCLYLCKNNLIILTGNIFRCDECNESFKNTTDPKEQIFFSTFKLHNKRGYKCPECDRFIPHPIYGGTNTITCPYLDCYFVGDICSLKKTHHPSSQTNPERLYGDIGLVKSIDLDKTNLIQDSLVKLEEQETLHNKIKTINDVIDSQISSVPYSGADFTLMHKMITYQAFKNLLNQFPQEMVDYLLHQSRSGGFQNKIFKEYVKLLEASFPYCYKKGSKVYRIDSLLDPNLNIFDGISTYDAKITDKLEIKNNTKEFYIGSRKATYSKPYYIGKLLNVIDKQTKQPLLKYVKDYGFSNIKMQGVNPGTEVIVTHLRVPPHYQMGGMVYINRLRKKIVDKSLSILSKNNV
jgi:hypothetical protein